MSEVNVYVVLKHGEGFEIENGEYYERMAVPIQPKDSKPLIFLLKAVKEGSYTINIDFFQERNVHRRIEIKYESDINELDM